MVKKRGNPEFDTKMPVKTRKDQVVSQREAESASMSDKDNSDFSSKATKFSSRELRNRFVIASKKKSLRFTNEVKPSRHMRSCRMAISGRQHYTLSQSDEDEEDSIFPARASRSSRLRHSKRHLSSPEPSNDLDTPLPKRHCSTASVNGHSNKSGPEEEELHEEDSAGIRRSTRQRKLKYDNYSDSWIVGAQTLKGYPQNNYVDLRDVYNSTPYPLRRGRKIKEEDDERDEELDEDKNRDETEEGDTEDNEENNRRTRSAGVERRKSERQTNDKARNENQEEEEEEEEENEEEEKNPTKNAANTSGFEDMYSRVKRQRTRRSIYDSSMLNMRNMRRQQQRKCIDRQENSSEESESSTEDDPPPRKSNRERVIRRKYHLRETKPTVKRFQITHVEEPRRKSSRTIRAVLCETMRRRRHRSSSSDSSSSRDRHYDRKKTKSTKDRSRLPTLLAGEDDARRGKPEGGGRLADVDPVSLDTSIRFSHVGGLEEHVRCLQEMVVFPMLYAEVFRKYHVTPPKGVLFHGPPGTGKTLIARALANECSQGERKVTFFMRKGADCLSKWVGESERQLRILFEEAHQARPSIIFFDELDGLAPVRSAKQDQIHASIVSTLLALMDGLDDRGEIVVIGATNRVDAIDPALRRPGRFDRELLFPLPGNKERQEILKIHVNKWENPPSPVLLNHLAEKAAGYCGSDLRALCSEAVIQALRRRYPQIYKSNRKLLLDPDNVKVERCDFELAQRGIVPASHRVAPSFGRKLPNYLEPLLGETVNELTAHIRSVFTCGFVKGNKSVRVVKSPRLLLLGQRKATSLVTAAILHKMESCPVLTLDLATIYSESARSPEEATVQVLNEVRRNIPSVLYVPGITEFWKTVSPAVRAIFKSLLSQLDPTLPILLLATAVTEIPDEVRPMFSIYQREEKTVKPFTAKQKEDFFKPLIMVRAMQRPPKERKREPLEDLPEAPPPPPPKLNEEQLRKLYAQEEHKLRELRIFLRQICGKLARNKAFYMFSKPVDINEVPDYLTIIAEPMDLETMMTKIDLHKYTCAQDFLNDVELICANALEYNPDRDPADKLIRHSACSLRDTAYALIKAEMDSDFEDRCREIRRSRVDRGINVNKFAPEFVQTAELVEQQQKLANGSNSQPLANTPSGGAVGEDTTPANTNPNHKPNSVPVRKLNKSSLLRRKKGSSWCRGIVKPRVKAKSLGNTSLSPESKNKSGVKKEETETMDEDMDSEKIMAHSTPMKKDTSDTATRHDSEMVNGIDRISSEEEEEDDAEVEIDERLSGGSGINESAESDAASPSNKSSARGEGKQLTINKSALTHMLAEAVKVTLPIESLEMLIDLYAQLRQVISRYSRLWNRSQLPKDIEDELQRFAAEHEEITEHDETFSSSVCDGPTIL